MSYDHLKTTLQGYNWDDGFDIPQTILDDPVCDLALALEIFYLADGYSYLAAAATGSGNWQTFINRLYNEIVNGKYSKTDRHFAIPLNRVAKYKFRKMGVSEIFLTDL